MNGEDLSKTAWVLLGLLLVSALVPVNYAGVKVLKWLSSGGRSVSGLALVGMSLMLLLALGFGAGSAARKWPSAFVLVAVACVLVLAVGSMWMMANLAEAREGLFVFVVSLAVLALLAGASALYEKVTNPAVAPRRRFKTKPLASRTKTEATPLKRNNVER